MLLSYNILNEKYIILDQEGERENSGGKATLCDFPAIFQQFSSYIQTNKDVVRRANLLAFNEIDQVHLEKEARLGMTEV